MASQTETEASRLLGQLSDSMRLRMLRLLEREELSVGEVARVLQIPQSTASRQLKVLLGGGWLVKRLAGTATYYRLVLDELDTPGRALWLAVRENLLSAADLAEDDRRLKIVLTERMTDSEGYFGRVAGAWDAVRRELFGERFTAEAIIGLMPPEWEVADLGCGTGNNAELLGTACRRGYAIDQSSPMLDAARQRLADRENIEFLAGELERLPLPDRAVDAVTCTLVLHHVDDPVAALAEMRRVLRTRRGGGAALVVDMFPHDRHEYRHRMGHKHLGFSSERMEQMCDSAGFDAVRVRALTLESESQGPSLFAARAWVRPRRSKHSD